MKEAEESNETPKREEAAAFSEENPEPVEAVPESVDQFEGSDQGKTN